MRHKFYHVERIAIVILLLCSCASSAAPVILNKQDGWKVTQVVRYESRQPYAIVRDDLEIAFLHSFTGKDTWIHIKVQFQNPLENATNYTYRLSDTWLRISGEEFNRALVFPCEELKPVFNLHHGIDPNAAFKLAMERKFPEVEAVRVAPSFKAKRGCVVAFLMTPFPSEKTTFTIRLGGLLKDGQSVQVPDVEFRSRP